MSPVFSARRRAEEFNAAVEGTSTSRDPDARYAEFLELVQGMRETVPVTARPEFVAELRGALMDEARTAARTGQGAEVAARLTVTRAPRHRRRERRLAVAVGGLAIVGATAGMSVASQSALPGDPLYPLKRAIENAQAGVQVDEDAKGKSLLDSASGRLDEVDQLSRERKDAETISDTLQTFTDQANEASDLLISDYSDTGRKASVEDLRDFTSSSMSTLRRLETLVPEDARASLIEAAQTLTQIDERALVACPSCGPDIIAQIPSFDPVALDELLGSVNETLANQPADQPTDKQGDQKSGKKGDNKSGDDTSDDGTPGTDDDGNLIDDTLDDLTGQDNDQPKDEGGQDEGGQDQTDKGLLENTTDTLKGLLGGVLGGG